MDGKLVGQFESLIAGTVRSKHTFRRYCEVLEQFFNRFPRKRKPQQFCVSDIECYKRSRLAEGISPKTLALEIGVVRNFFNWFRSEYAPDWPNPASTRRPKDIPCSSIPSSQSGSLKPASDAKLHKEANEESTTYGKRASRGDTCFVRWKAHYSARVRLDFGRFR
jgi:hypothetical protein